METDLLIKLQLTTFLGPTSTEQWG